MRSVMVECGLGLKNKETECSAFKNEYSEARMNTHKKKEIWEIEFT